MKRYAIFSFFYVFVISLLLNFGCDNPSEVESKSILGKWNFIYVVINDNTINVWAIRYIIFTENQVSFFAEGCTDNKNLEDDMSKGTYTKTSDVITIIWNSEKDAEAADDFLGRSYQLTSQLNYSFEDDNLILECEVSNENLKIICSKG